MTPRPPLRRTGAAKTKTMDTGPRALGLVTSLGRNSPYEVVREFVSHIPVLEDGTTPCLLADGSAACAPSPARPRPRLPLGALPH